jgi:hypothetical protein
MADIDFSPLLAGTQSAINAFPSTLKSLSSGLNEYVTGSRAANDELIAMIRDQQKNQVSPLLALGAGLLKPTRTGAFAESVGYGADNYTQALQQQRNDALDRAMKIQTLQSARAKLGLDAAQTQMQILQGQMGLPGMASQMAGAVADLGLYGSGTPGSATAKGAGAAGVNVGGASTQPPVMPPQAAPGPQGPMPTTMPPMQPARPQPPQMPPQAQMQPPAQPAMPQPAGTPPAVEPAMPQPAGTPPAVEPAMPQPAGTPPSPAMPGAPQGDVLQGAAGQGAMAGGTNPVEVQAKTLGIDPYANAKRIIMDAQQSPAKYRGPGGQALFNKAMEMYRQSPEAHGQVKAAETAAEEANKLRTYWDHEGNSYQMTAAEAEKRGLSPAESPFMKPIVEEYGKFREAGVEFSRDYQPAKQQLLALAKIYQDRQLGRLSELKANMYGIAKSLGVPLPAGWDADAASFDAALKTATQEAFTQMRNSGASKAPATGLREALITAPNPNNDPAANYKIIRDALAALDASNDLYTGFFDAGEKDVGRYVTRFNKTKPISEYVKKAEEQIGGTFAGQGSDLGGNVPKGGKEPVRVKSVDEYNELPKGTEYIDPNGRRRTKQ